MKQGIRSLLDVEVGIDVSLCERIEFVCVQGEARKLFEWPSDKATQTGERTIALDWTAEDKAAFAPGIVKMDTRITLKDSEHQPETEIVSFMMSDTLFREADHD